MKPNILLIMTDQQRYDSLGCYGFSAIPTPNIDSIGENGIVFKNCYVNNPVCTPSRASIFTGKSLTGHGVYRLNDILPSAEKLFPEYLRKAGYETALFGKLHVSSAVFEKDNRNKYDGFDRYCWNHEPVLFEDSPFNEYSAWLKQEHPDFYAEYFNKRRGYGSVPAELHCTTFLTNMAADFISNRSSDTPFFCCLSVFDPHNPYNDCPEEGLAAVREDVLPEPNVCEADRYLPEDIIREREHGYMKNVGIYTKADMMEMRKGYYGSIAFLDMQLKKVLDALKIKGIMENTMILFVSDHGDMLGDHDLLAKGAFFFDACTRVPLLIKPHGGVTNPIRVNTLVQPSDIAATVLAAAGYCDTEIKKIAPGSDNLLGLKADDKDRAAVCMYRGTGICDTMSEFTPPIYATMFRKGDYKLNLYHNFYNSPPEGELYDISRDPGETNNLWSSLEYEKVKVNLILDYMNWQTAQDVLYNSSRGGHTQSVTQSMLNTEGGKG